MPSRLACAAFGVLATITGPAVGHLVAAATDPASSPVLAVGSTVIDLTPTPVKDWAVAEFGTKDKPILIGSVLLGTLVLAGVAGLLAKRRFVVGAGLLVALVAVAGAAALSRPTADAVDVLPSVVAGLVAFAGLWAVVATVAPVASGARAAPGSGRRGLLVAGGLVGLAAVVHHRRPPARGDDDARPRLPRVRRPHPDVLPPPAEVAEIARRGSSRPAYRRGRPGE